ncbi:ARMADILLO BTB ARABIDOPSIS PROTEIN 1-like isoform X1 [Musa acuminata AAA Group]
MQITDEDTKGKKVLDSIVEIRAEGSSVLPRGDMESGVSSQENLDELLAASLAAEEEMEINKNVLTSEGGLDEAEDDNDENEEMIFPMDNIHIDPAVLASLPPSMQLDLLVQMRESIIAENRQKYQKIKKDSHNQAGIVYNGGLVPLPKLLDSKNGCLQHNAAFALYGIAENEDNVSDFIKVGGFQKLQDGEFIIQATKDCVAKTMKRLEEKINGRVLNHLLYLMRVGEKAVQRRIALALAFEGCPKAHVLVCSILLRSVICSYHLF